MAFELRFPYRPNNPLQDSTKDLNFNVDKLSVSLRWRPPYVILLIGPFDTELEAKEYLPRVWGALAWTAIVRGSGFSANMTWSHVSYPEDPFIAAKNVASSFGMPDPGTPLHALGTDYFPCVAEIGKNYRFIGGGDLKVKLMENAESLAGILAEGLKSKSIEILYVDERLRTSLQLYSDSHREPSLRAKFLTVVMALEVLTEPIPKHPIAQDLLDRFEVEVNNEVAKHLEDSVEWQSLDFLKREICFRRESSLRSRIRDLVLSSLSFLSPEDLGQQARDAVWAYDQRSALVHDGRIPDEKLSKAYELAKHTLVDVLRARAALSGPYTAV
ncbi:HEPN domain-containing protein [Synechococcus sp. CCY 9618]|uniref:HEPN domain-containing protein n=1 Tax=Synechococcus sp. CCY 9618 TaxID=2815602 RepID=UPI001C22CCCE|nr:HEPN domain-containing protein [Synechococcus sp. CCY 9618]